MARRKALKWHKWETKCADAAALVALRPMLRFHFRDGSLLQRPASENGHKEQDTPPAAFLRITYILSNKTEKVTILSPTLQGSFLASPFVKAFVSAKLSSWSNLVLVFLTTAPLKKQPNKKESIKVGQWLCFKWSDFKADQNQNNLQSVLCLLLYKVLLAIAIFICGNKSGGVRTIQPRFAGGCSAWCRGCWQEGSCCSSWLGLGSAEPHWAAPALAVCPAATSSYRAPWTFPLG